MFAEAGERDPRYRPRRAASAPARQDSHHGWTGSGTVVSFDEASEQDRGKGILPPPTVPADRYDEDYYLHVCGGSDEWRTSQGTEIAGIYAGSLQEAHLRPGEVVVDIGTGRGELLVAALEAGASRAVGIEYSDAAVELARRTLDVHGVEPPAGEIVAADARAIPLPDKSADLVTMLDVVEHLTSSELAGSLREAYRLLRPGGRVVVHTFPTRTLYSITYRLQRLAVPTRLRRWPRDPRNEWERSMHVNEQTVSTLRRALRSAGFSHVEVRPGIWVYTGFLPDPRAAALYHRLARHRLTARFGASNLWGRGVRT
jgi:ubiquinone/menaquinone biosynthesis C-methylase UbiE